MEHTNTAKTLKINTAVCDARHVKESTLAAYDAIEINAAFLLADSASQELLHKYPVTCNAVQTLDISGDVQVSQINGRKELGPGTPAPQSPTFLMVNGVLDIAPGAEEALSAYVGIQVNGQIICPESLSGLLSAVSVNGQIETYPDDCIRLKRTVVLDRTFILRARQGARYFAGRRVVALAKDIDFGKLADKQVSFVTRELLVAESLAEAAVPLFSPDTEITVLPDDCAYVADNVKLDGSLVRRYGGKLYINGDLILDQSSAPWLEQVSSLYVNGDILTPKSLSEAVCAVAFSYHKLQIIGGLLIRDKISVTVDRAMLESAADGVSLTDCVTVQLQPDVDAELIRQRLVSVVDCVNVLCTDEQRSAVELAAENVVHIGEDKENHNFSLLRGKNGGKTVNAVNYKL